MGDGGGGGDDLHSGDNGVGGNSHVDMKPSAEYLMGLGYGGGGVVGRKDGGGSSALTAAYPPPAESPANSGKAHFFIFRSEEKTTYLISEKQNALGAKT
jgi:hypothetical protein